MTNNEREKNLKTIREFLTLRGVERHDRRNELAAPGARVYVRERAGEESISAENNKPTSYDFIEWNRESCAEYPDYGPSHYDIFECDDPRKYAVRCEAHGKRDDGTPFIFRYIFTFLMEDGKIRIFEEHLDDLYDLYEQDSMKYKYAESNT